MNVNFFNSLRVLLLAAVAVFGAGGALVQAQDELSSQLEDLPHAIVDRVTHRVLQLVEEDGAKLEEDPEAFYRSVEQILEPVIAFDYIARGVMGDYAKQASAEQRQRFTHVFQNNLVSTYAKGMLLYANLQVEVLPPEEEIGGSRKVSVVQKVYGADSEHVVVYTMGKSRKDNQWKLLNVIINGVNLGNTFRSQFDQAMKKEVNLDRVIDNWAS